MKVKSVLGVLLIAAGGTALLAAAVLAVIAIHALATKTGQASAALLNLFAAVLYTVPGFVAFALGRMCLSKRASDR